MSKFFYDTEFLEGTQSLAFGRKTKPTIDLISIGIKAEDGREYYAISKDFNIKEAWNRFDLKQNQGMGDANNLPPVKVYWIRENVLKPIYWELYQQSDVAVKQDYGNFNNFAGDPISNDLSHFTSLIKEYGKSNDKIAEEIKTFCSKRLLATNPNQYEGDSSPIELYGYYSAYDHVVFMWLFGIMMNKPERFPMFTIDLKQMLDEKLNKFFITLGETYNGKSNTVDREATLIEKLSWIKSRIEYPKETNAHHALADAKWNYELYLFITKSTWALLNNPTIKTMEGQDATTGTTTNSTGETTEKLSTGTTENVTDAQATTGTTTNSTDETGNDATKETTTQSTGEVATEKSEATKEEVRSEVLLYPKEGDILTQGQKAVGFTFNPSKDPRVDKAKLLAAAAIDQMIELQKDANSYNGTKRHAAVAITEFESAQMRAVKAITWSE